MVDRGSRILLTLLVAWGLAPAPVFAARWIPLAPPDGTRPIGRLAHAAVLDAPGRRLIAWGDRIPPGEVWALSLDGPAVWTRIATQGTPPPARILFSAVFDPVRRQMLIFGGGVYETSIAYRNDVWALSLDGPPTWTEVTPAGTPPTPRQMHAAVYDPVRDRMLVFGGISSASPPYVEYENEVWELTLTDPPAWNQLAPAGTPPDGLLAASMIYDAVADRAIVFGGENYTDYSNMYRNETFALALGGISTWSKLLPIGTPPSPRYEHSAVMDEAGGRMLVFGGRGLNLIPTRDTWALKLRGGSLAWTRLATDSVLARSSTAAILDPVLGRLVVDGGTPNDYRLFETIALPLAGPLAWQRLQPIGPPVAPAARYYAGTLVDPATNRLFVEDGGDYTAYPDIPRDLWSWPLDAASPSWSPITLAVQPPGSYNGRPVLDPVRRRQIHFFTGAPSEASFMSLDALGTWEPLVAGGTPPPPRSGFSVAYDPTGDRIFLAGGYVDPRIGHARRLFRDVWALSLDDPPAWQQIRPDVAGVWVQEDNLFVDVQEQRLIASGWDDTGGWIWTRPLDGSADWSRLYDAFPPSNGASLALDQAARELVTVDLQQRRVWTLGLTALTGWAELAVDGEPPAARSYTRLEWDAARRRLVFFGGLSRVGIANAPLGDLWALELDQPTPVALSLVSADASEHAVRLRWWAGSGSPPEVSLERRRADEDWARLAGLAADGVGGYAYEDLDVAAGGRYGYRLVSDGAVWPQSEAWVTVPAVAKLALAGARPNPSSGAPAIVFTLATDRPARLELLDLTGRRVESREVGALGAGEHLIRLRDGLAPGIYVARLTQGAEARSATLAITR